VRCKKCIEWGKKGGFHFCGVCDSDRRDKVESMARKWEKLDFNSEITDLLYDLVELHMGGVRELQDLPEKCTERMVLEGKLWERFNKRDDVALVSPVVNRMPSINTMGDFISNLTDTYIDSIHELLERLEKEGSIRAKDFVGAWD